MIKEEILNRIKVKPLLDGGSTLDEKMIRGGKFFATPYNCTFLCAKRQSGKTSVLGEIIFKTSNKKTKFHIFCPTTQVDNTWKLILEKLERNGNEVNVYSSIVDGKGKNAVDNLKSIVASLSKEDEEEEPATVGTGVVIEAAMPRQPKPTTKLFFGGCDECENDVKAVCELKKEEIVAPEKQKKGKTKIAPEHIFIFDDISEELKSPSLVSLLKKSRHFKAACYISSQWPLDLLPQQLKQLDYCLVFKGINEEKLGHVHKMLDLSMDFEKFHELYNWATSTGRWDFLYIDSRRQKYRKNFNVQLSI